MIRYGIVGVGGYAARWVEALQALEPAGVARLAAAVVRNPERYAGEVARLEGRGCTIFRGLDEMLARGRGLIDVAGLPTGIADHVPMATRCLETGYNVLIEKPVAGTVQEVADLRQAERRTGRWCAVGYQFLYSPTIQWLRGILASGRLGTLREARSVTGWPRGDAYYARNPWAGQLCHGGAWILDGPATNASAHHLTNMLYLAGVGRGAGGIRSVRAELYRGRPIPGYDTSCLDVLTTDGARLLHYASHALDEPLEPLMDLFCERGHVHWRAEDNSATVHYDDGTEEQHPGEGRSALQARVLAQVARVAAGQEPAPLCGVAEGGPQVLAVNLAFESSAGVAPIPEPYVDQGIADDGSALACIRGMRALLGEALARGGTFSELGAPWATLTKTVPAEGYNHFPRDPTLARLGASET